MPPLRPPVAGGAGKTGEGKTPELLAWVNSGECKPRSRAGGGIVLEAAEEHLVGDAELAVRDVSLELGRRA